MYKELLLMWHQNPFMLYKTKLRSVLLWMSDVQLEGSIKRAEEKTKQTDLRARNPLMALKITVGWLICVLHL
jgi:hypothetical protein